MVKGVVYLWAMALMGCILLPLCSTQEESFRVAINRYSSDENFVNRSNIILGTQLILVCQVVGLPYGTPLSYIWTCPNGPCEVEGDYGREIYNEHILAINITSTSDGGVYTCQVTATVGAMLQENRARVRFTISGGVALHSYGRLLPTNFLVTEPEQIEGPDGLGRVNCTSTESAANFQTTLLTSVTKNSNEDMYQIRQDSTATLIVRNTRVANFANTLVYCNGLSHSLYLHLSAQNSLATPRPIQVTEAASTLLRYQVSKEFNSTARNFIGGLHVTRFGVPMVVVYTRVPASHPIVEVESVVPGAKYSIEVWGISEDNTRSQEPGRQTATVEERRPSSARRLTVTRVLQDGVELNWLPPSAPNGEVHYVIYYTPEGGTEQLVDTNSNLTHYNLTGLERNRVYTNIAVQAVNSAGSSGRRQNAILTNYNHSVEMMQPGGSNGDQNVKYLIHPNYITIIFIGIPAAIVLLLLICVVILLVTGVVCLVRKRRGRIGKRFEVELQIQDRAENAVTPTETTICRPCNFESHVPTIPTERRVLETRRSCIYHTMLHARDHHHNTLMTSLLIKSKSKNSKDGSTIEAEDYDNPVDKRGSGVRYQPIHENQVQMHQYASLGATNLEEGSAQSYI